MKFFKISMVTFLMLCSASTGAMAAIVEDYSDPGSSYERIFSRDNWTDTIDLSDLNLSDGDGLMVEITYSSRWEDWRFYGNGEEVGTLATTGKGFEIQTFYLDDFDEDTLVLALSDSSKNGPFMLLDAISFTRISSVPAPAALWLFGSGLLGLAVFRRNRQI